MSIQPWPTLVPHLLKVGLDSKSAVERLKQFMTGVLAWNRTASNLISRNDEKRFVERHLVESIEPAHWLKSTGAATWIDFGSGGGLPAIPLALVGIGPKWILVE
jgi:16S rRNA G527 N7-methylase RsmG